MRRPPIEAGGRLIWESRAGGVAGYSGSTRLGVAALAFVGSSTMCTCMLPFGSSFERPAFSWVIAAAPVVALAAIAGVWLLRRVRPTFFLTDDALFERRLFGGFERWALAELVEAQVYVYRYRDRYGPREIVTSRLELVFRGASGDRRILFGPSPRIEELQDLLVQGVLSDWIDLRAVPAIEGEPAPAELGGKFFVCRRSRSDGFEYGPLFLGPTRVVRITEPLESDLLARFYTLLARAESPSEAEAALSDIMHGRGAGHYVEVPREGAVVRLEGSELRVAAPEASFEVELEAGDAERLRGYLALSSRTAGGR